MSGEIRVERALEKENKLAEDPLLKQGKREKTQLLVIILVIAALLAIASGTFSVLKKSDAPQKLSVDRLHELNKQGKLDPEKGYLYNDHSFVKEDGLWWTDVYLLGTIYKTPLHFGPREVETIPIAGRLDDSFNSQADIYVVIDPETVDKYYTLALSELSFNLAKVMNRAPLGSCSKQNEVCEGRDVISCETAAGKPVIELIIGSDAKIELAGSCIKITGQDYEIVKAVDRLLYRWYGVME